MYPGDEDYFLKLHLTYSHDLKCYSSGEDRCIMSAASFLQGFLGLEASIHMIAATMVRKDEPVL